MGLEKNQTWYEEQNLLWTWKLNTNVNCQPKISGPPKNISTYMTFFRLCISQMFNAVGLIVKSLTVVPLKRSVVHTSSWRHGSCGTACAGKAQTLGPLQRRYPYYIFIYLYIYIYVVCSIYFNFNEKLSLLGMWELHVIACGYDILYI